VSLPTIWQRVALVLMGVPVAVFVNVLRVATLGVLTLVNPEFAAGEFHHFIGLLWLVPAFLLYLLVLWILSNLVVTDTQEAAHAG
jgi:exosortase/archaeosortase family protein